MSARVLALSLSPTHTFSKSPQQRLKLVAEHGVEGDAHFGVTVKHRSRVAKNPDAPNLRQVHLIHQEMLDRVASSGLDLKPGDIGENILTAGVDLLALSRGARLQMGSAEVEVTGLRNPCLQLDNFKPGLRRAFLQKRANGEIIRLAGVMAIVAKTGEVSLDDLSKVTSPTTHTPLEVV